LENNTDRPILFFDGHCLLCNKTVQWVIKHDKKAKFTFVAVPQNEDFWNLIPNGMSLKKENSVILFDNQKFHVKSTAAILVCRKLGFPFNLMTFFLIVPPFIRNGIYSYIARNRYRWFGRSQNCMIPSPSQKNRFLSPQDPIFLDLLKKY
jgi:predicted DCC family thiol-disulfide oxidoreductase YuxK